MNIRCLCDNEDVVTQESQLQGYKERQEVFNDVLSNIINRGKNLLI